MQGRKTESGRLILMSERISNSAFTLQITLQGSNPFQSGSIQRTRLHCVYTRWWNGTVTINYEYKTGLALIFWTVNTFRKCVVTTMFRYHSVQHKRTYGNAYWFNPKVRYLFTLAIGLIWINLDWTSLVVPCGSIWIDSGRIYTAC